MNLSEIFGNVTVGGIAAERLILALLSAFITSLLISFVYKKTYTGVSFTKNALLTYILLTMVTAIAILTVNSNLGLSIGMAGALSIVRFRTAVKDPIDSIFMFWSITAGLMCGAGLYPFALLASMLLGIFYMLSHKLVFKQPARYLLVINVNKDNASLIIDNVSNIKKTILKTESIKNNNVELTFEISGSESSKLLLKLKEKEGVESVHLVNIN